MQSHEQVAWTHGHRLGYSPLLVAQITTRLNLAATH